MTNSEVFDFTITNEDMALIDSLENNTRIGPDPENFAF